MKQASSSGDRAEINNLSDFDHEYNNTERVYNAPILNKENMPYEYNESMTEAQM
jgi:hypothetical protein